MANFTFTASAADSLIGADDVADNFTLATATFLAGTDTLRGGGGATPDVLRITTGVTLGTAAFANVRGIDRIQLFGTTDSFITLDNAMVASGDLSLFLVKGGAAADRIRGNLVLDRALVLDGGAGDDFLEGGGGNDELRLGTGADTARGGAGDDTIIASLADLDTDDRLDGGAGIDTLLLQSGGTLGDAALNRMVGIERIILAAGVTQGLVVTISGSRAAALAPDGLLTIQGGGGNDLLSVSTNRAAAELWGWAGNDALSGSTLADTLDGGAGADTLAGGAGNDILDGGSEDDRVSGGDGNDLLRGGAGADRLTGGAGADRFVIGAVADLPSLAPFGFKPANLTLVDRVTDFEIGDLIDLSAIPGLSFIGDRAFEGVAGQMRFAAYVFPASGGAGPPTHPVLLLDMDGNGVADRMFGLPGFLGALEETAPGSSVLVGLAARRLTGTAAADTLEGGAGADTLRGAQGDDVMIGGAGNDSLDGGGGNDLAIGGAGYDTISVAAGDDTVRIESAEDLSTSQIAGIVDVIMGFGEGDRLDLSAFVGLTWSYMTPLAPSSGPQAAPAITATGTIINFDLDGNGVAERFLSLPGLTAPLDFTAPGSGVLRLARPLNLTLETSGTLYGGPLGDTLNGSSGNDTLYGGGGNDLLFGNGGNNAQVGDDGDDTLIGSMVTDYLYGGAGNDLLEGRGGNDYLSGGAGDDTLVSSGSHYTILTGLGSDVVMLQNRPPPDTSFVNIIALPDFAVGDLLDLRQWTDLIYIGDRPFTGTPWEVRFVDGDSRFEIGSRAGYYADIRIDGSGPMEMVSPGLFRTAVPQILTGTVGADSLVGAGARDTLFGLDGADTLIGNGSGDSLDGGAGDDLLNGGAGNDILVGGAGDDLLIGGVGLNTLIGGAGNDRFFFEPGLFETRIADFAEGDLIDLAAFRPFSLIGEAPFSDAGAQLRLSYFLAGGYVDQQNPGVNLQFKPSDDAGTVFTIVLLNFRESLVETAPGSGVLHWAARLPVIGTEAADTIIGLASLSGDIILGLGGNDLLFGEGGPDSLDGGADADTLHGGAHNDTLDGGAGNDRLFGEQSADRLNGGTGNDWLEGGDGDDVLNGGDGADTLFGGTGADGLTGGAGIDRFVFISSGESTNVAYDQITDFFAGSAERLDFSLMDANVGIAGLQDFTFIGSARFSNVGQIRFDPKTNLLEANNAGTLNPDLRIHLLGVAALTVDDFLF